MEKSTKHTVPIQSHSALVNRPSLTDVAPGLRSGALRHGVALMVIGALHSEHHMASGSVGLHVLKLN